MTYAVVRVRGTVNVKPDTKKTLQLLNLTKANHCVLLEEKPSIKLSRLFSYILFGISLLFFLLIPLWLNIFFNVIIYPYILLIPGTFVILSMVLYFSTKVQTSIEKEE